jgi:hypothetical protein
MTRSARRQGARIDHIASVAFELLVRAVKWRARKCHQPRPRGFEDAEGGDEFHERVDSGGFGGAGTQRSWLVVLGEGEDC